MRSTKSSFAAPTPSTLSIERIIMPNWAIDRYKKNWFFTAKQRTRDLSWMRYWSAPLLTAAPNSCNFFHIASVHSLAVAMALSSEIERHLFHNWSNLKKKKWISVAAGQNFHSGGLVHGRAPVRVRTGRQLGGSQVHRQRIRRLQQIEWIHWQRPAVGKHPTFHSDFQTFHSEIYFDVQERSETIATFSLCGFANPGSIGTQIAALSTMAPGRKSDLAEVAFRAFISGTVACFMTACIAGKTSTSGATGALTWNWIQAKWFGGTATGCVSLTSNQSNLNDRHVNIDHSARIKLNRKMERRREIGRRCCQADGVRAFDWRRPPKWAQEFSLLTNINQIISSL